MIFAVDGHIEQIIAGTKTQTRRRLSPETRLISYSSKYKVTHVTVNGRVKYRMDGIYSVQPGRGKKGLAKIKILEIRECTSSYISEEDALAEGGYTPFEYYAVLRQLYSDVPAFPMYALTFEYVQGSQIRHRQHSLHDEAQWD